MRVILFRGKHKDEWLYGDFIHHYGTQGDSIFWYKGKDNRRYIYAVEAKTVGQYTGLTDKNGTKIFEGDILQFSYIGDNRGVDGKSKVEFKNGKFGVRWGWHKEFIALDGFANTYIDIIGNIHDNPELLED